jgi:AcrR family transcriptional regulator
VSTRQIAKAAGVNHAAIAYYFAGKEAFYAACLDHIAVSVNREMRGFFKELKLTSNETTMPYRQCERVLGLFIANMTRFFLGGTDRVVISRIVLREMLDPTPAFERLYEGLLRQMHESMTRIIARLTGVDPGSREAIIRTHAILGQVLVFHHARAVIERRLAIKKFSQRDIADVIATVTSHTFAITKSYRRVADAKR